MELMPTLIGEGFTIAAIVGAARANRNSLTRRVAELERTQRSLPKDYVPRSEVELALANIEKTTEHTRSLVQALLYSGGDKGFALKMLEASAEDDLIASYRRIAPQFEGYETFPYLDSDGLVTWGIGCMSPDAHEFCQYPWRHQGSLALATDAEKIAEFAIVKRMVPDCGPKFYFSPRSLILLPADVDGAFHTKCAGYLGQLRHVFLAFDTFPLSKQIALLDMTFNLGIGMPPRHDFRGTGLQMYTHLVAAALAGNWAACASACGRDVHVAAFGKRNAWTRSQFLEPTN